MQTSRLCWRPVLRLVAVLLGLAVATRSSHAQRNDSGVIEGRVLNAALGDYLNNARVSLEAARQEVFTDAFGQYRFSRVPPGEVKVRVFYTGFPTQEQIVTVAAGQTVQLDFNLRAGAAPAAGSDSPVRLGQFVVEASKEMSGAAIAINEQRFAPNLVTVLSTDEFGTIPEGNIGEFLKFIPGISIDYNGGDARYVSLNGTPQQYTPITLGGFDLASAASSTTARTVELEQVSINNLARVEFVKSPTPESPGNALSGSVNLVPRTAFERSKPVFNYSVFAMMRDDNRELRKTPGPLRDPEVKVHPGFDFSWTVPVSKRFGFTLAAATSEQYAVQSFIQQTWVGTLETPGAAAIAAGASQANPYLRDFIVDDGPKNTARTSWSATLDFKPGRYDVLSLGFQWALFDADWIHRQVTFSPQGTTVAPARFGPGFMHGAAGAGLIVVNNSGGGSRKTGTTFMPMLSWRHDGRTWKAEAGVAVSHASNHYRDIANGRFANVELRRSALTINYDDIFYLRPRVITVTAAGGAAFDPYAINNYAVVNGSSSERDSSDVRRSAFAKLRRDFDVGVPLSLRTGLDVRQQQRDIQTSPVTWNYVGADGRGSTTPVGSDDGAGFLLDPSFSQRTLPYGFPKMQWPSNWTAFEHFKAHPTYWVANPVTSYNGSINASKYAEEIVSSAYLRGDTAFFQRRLKLVGGVRAEQTNIKAEAVLSDNSRNFQRDPSGNVRRNAAGQPLLIAPAGSLEAAQIIGVRRGSHAAKEYLRLFPSLNASFDLRENLIARAAWYESLGRPDFGQYAGTLTLPDLESAPSTSNRIAVNNPLIKPWKAETKMITLEYYFPRVGLLSASAFQRDFTNFFLSSTSPATPGFLAAFDLSDDYLRYDVATNRNSAFGVRIKGTEFSYKQALTFLPHFARGLTMFANYTAQRVSGVEAGNITGGNFVPYLANWGIRLDRPRFSLNLNWNYRARLRQNYIAATNSYVFYNRRLYVDLNADYYLLKNRRLGVFAAMRNLRDQPEVDNEVLGPNTPRDAQLRQIWHFGALWTFGLKGTF